MSHSIYAFSSSHRWIEGACPASIRMAIGYPNLSNPAAELGTAVHALGEFCIGLGIHPNQCIGMTFDGHVVNDKMAEDAALYRNVIDELSIRYGVKPLLEQRVVMSSLGRTDVYGTSDCTFIVLIGRTLHTIDYKNGYGLVEVEDNSQTAGYSVATLDTFDLWDKVDTVINTIIQPNYPHIEGPVRHIIYTMQDMINWREKFRRSVILAEDRTQLPNAGEWCDWCPAQANCRARMEYVLDKAYTNVPFTEIPIGQIEQIYKATRGIKVFLDKVDARMVGEARKGHQFNDYKLVKTWPRAKCDDVNGLLAEAKVRGIDPLKLYNDPQLVGITKAKKLLGEQIAKQFYKSPEPTTSLVPMSDNKPAIRVGKATGVFAPINTTPPPSANGVFEVIS